MMLELDFGGSRGWRPEDKNSIYILFRLESHLIDLSPYDIILVYNAFDSLPMNQSYINFPPGKNSEHHPLDIEQVEAAKTE